MRIIHCLIQYFPEHIAGTEVYIHTLAKLQKAKGHEVAVITPHIEYYRPGKIREHYQYDGIDVYQFKETANPKDRNIYSGKKKPEGIYNFLALIKMLKADIVHFHELNRSTGMTIEHVKAAKLTHIKVFVTMHLSSYTCNINKLITNNKLCSGKISEFDCSACTYNSKLNVPPFVSQPLASLSVFLNYTGIAELLKPGKLTTFISMPTAIRRIKYELNELVKHADQIIALTDWYKKILLINDVPVNKVTVIPQAPAFVTQRILKTNNSTVNLPIKVVFIGRIQFLKGIHLLIEIFENFSAAEAMLDIYGQEENTDYYKKCLERTATMKNVSWKGLIKRDDVVEKLAGYDLLCVPSLSSEMSPLVIQEAFAAGTPVLASKVYGNMEQIRHGKNGLLFTFNSAASLMEQLKLVIDRPGLICEMRSNIVQPGSFEFVCNRYLDLYQSNRILL